MSHLTDLKNIFFKSRQTAIGARPGTLSIPDEASRPRITIISFDKDNVVEQDVDDVAILKTVFDEEQINWIDIQGFGDEDLLREIGEIFQLHPLVLEDIVNVPQRPKAELHGDQLLSIVRMARLLDDGTIDLEQVSIVTGRGYVLTFQERHGDVLDPVRERIRHGQGRPIRRSQADYLTYVIIDTIIDGYYPVIEHIGDRLETLEAVVLENPSPEILQDLNRTKNLLVNLRRVIWPHRELINTLMRDNHDLISQDVHVYLRDTYDHVVQTAEVIEMYREMASGLMNLYLSAVANRTNDVMKVLTIMATIFIPLTFLAGIYGMNFEYMPELHVRWAYPVIWLTMFLTAGAMIVFFKRKGWIGNSSG